MTAAAVPPKPITFGRYQKVAAILEADKAIKAKLGPRTEIVCKPPPSNEKVTFSKPVVYITETLHANGSDAHTTSKTDVLKLALKLMQEGDGEFKIPEDALRPAPPAAANGEGEAQQPKKPKAEKPKPAPKAEPPKPAAPPVTAKPVVAKGGSGLAKAPPRPVAKGGQPVPKTEPAPQTSHAETGSKRDESAPVESVRTQAAQTPAQAALKPGFPLTYGVCAVTMLMAVDQLMEAHDHSPGKKERQQKIADLIREYQALSVIPKSAKESSNAQ